MFRSECKLNLYLTTMYVYCVYPAISKSTKELPNCLKIAEMKQVSFKSFSLVSTVTIPVIVSFCRST